MKDLTVVSESVQRIYKYYLDKKLIVNRRYQRKLVWSIDEKASFIDSMIRSYPVPLILLAESKSAGELEIIDGMQRLNAIVAFIENEFEVQGQYFDLDTLAETKLLKDNGMISQKTPILDRKICTEFTGYSLPMSTYRGATTDEVDEVFRRINANGRHLSRQEIRQAGAVSPFAELVRKISCEIRGDSSLSDKIELNEMSKISITSRELDYGIKVDDLFWIKNSIITREQVRESKDEEIIADIIATMLLNETPSSSSTVLDEYYYLKFSDRRGKELENKLISATPEVVHNNFLFVYDMIKIILKNSSKPFLSLISKQKNFEKVPRYFQIIFLALYKITCVQHKRLQDINGLLDSLDDITSSVRLSRGGGNWSAKERETSINSIIGILQKNFVENLEDPAISMWSTQLETILQQSKTEQTCFDFKISLYNLETREYNPDVLNKVIKTLTAMANCGRNRIGYVIIGVADSVNDASRLAKIDNSYQAIRFQDFNITGVNFDVKTFGKGNDQFLQFVVNKIQNAPIETNYKNYITTNVRFLDYGGKMVLILKIKGLDKPASFSGEYYIRSGASLKKLEGREILDLGDSFQNNE